MPRMGDDDVRNREGVIETASATTSPDNAKSGPAAYVITVVALLALSLFVLSFGGCAAAVLGAVGSGSGRSPEYRLYDDDDYDDWLDDWNWLDDFDEDIDLRDFGRYTRQLPTGGGL